MRRLYIVAACITLIAAACASCIAADNEVHPNWWGKPPAEVQKPVVSGVVANISPTNIAVQTKDALKPFSVSEKTRVMVRGDKATIADVKVGDRVEVRFKPERNNVPMAVAIVVPKPSVNGEITSIVGNTINILKDKEEHQVIVNSDTKFRSNGYIGTLADLQVGYGITAHGDLSGNQLNADLVQFRPAVAKGAIVAIDGDVITVKTVKQLTIPCKSSPATSVILRPRISPNRKGALADVKVGMPANIGFAPNKEGAAQLFWIEVLTGE